MKKEIEPTPQNEMLIADALKMQIEIAQDKRNVSAQDLIDTCEDNK